jgi:DNA-binding NtrC family response regulator
MPAQIMIVNDNIDFLDQAADTLRQAGYDVATFTDPIAAIDAVRITQRVKLLITRVRFGQQKPHGVSLALMARNRDMRIRVLFTTSSDMAEHAQDVGEILITPVAMPELLSAVGRLLDSQSPTDA